MSSVVPERHAQGGVDLGLDDAGLGPELSSAWMSVIRMAERLSWAVWRMVWLI